MPSSAHFSAGFVIAFLLLHSFSYSKTYCTAFISNNSRNGKIRCGCISLLSYESDVDRRTTEYINCLVKERSLARWQGNYTSADILRNRIMNCTGIPPGYEIFLQDLPRSIGQESKWSLVRSTAGNDEEEFLPGTTVLQLAHAAMGLAIEDNQSKTQRQQFKKQESLEVLVQLAKSRLEKIEQEMIMQSTDDNDYDDMNLSFGRSTKKTMIQFELGGRKAADAAFWFALSGSKDTDLFHRLAEIASWELSRFGKRPSCRSKDVYQILERFAAAGLQRHANLEAVAQKCLQQKQEEYGLSKVDNYSNDADHSDRVTATDTDNRHRQHELDRNYLNLHSDRSLLLLWKISTKQKKQRAFLHSAQIYREQCQETNIFTEDVSSSFSSLQVESKENNVNSSYDWDELFEDASRPLVIDIGTGMGVSLLGLASTTDQTGIDSSRLMLGENNKNDDTDESQTDPLKWSDCNFIGVDLGALGIGYGQGIANRWNLQSRLHFVVDTAEDFFRSLHLYPGEICCCMIQFPTPFRFQAKKDGGNSQLPKSKYDGFMVTQELLELIHCNLHPKRGKLLLQSNCEDVAVWMRNLACQSVGFSALNDIVNDDNDNDIPPPYVDKEIDIVSSQERIPQRTLNYVAMGGERASGRGWFQRGILHSEGATETEVACAINGTPLHRCLLKV
mmetsp:Transcript_10203/g.11715  ORF Transcript_10203/g.11715 Transcript_10203/m.11715 type:complete len:674 (+) Transcript_10203:169-2190(+)